MGCLSSMTDVSIVTNIYTFKAVCSRRSNLVFRSERRGLDGSPFQKAAKLLSPDVRFEASKLKVTFLGEGLDKHPGIIPRTYTLTHCDLTANLNLAISNAINIDQLRGWYIRLQRDDVIAKWKIEKDGMSLHVHCHVSGDHILLDMAAELRYHIFSKELPLVLKALLHGDSMLFDEHPELMDATVWVHFHSNSRKYNRIECWGPLKDASEGVNGGGDDFLERNERLKTWFNPFHALVAFLL